MRIFNLTDVSTRVLEQQKLLNQHFAVGGHMVVPGEYVDVEDVNGTLRGNLVHLLTVGAVSIDNVPPAYAAAKQTTSGHLGTLPVRHVAMRETKVVGADEPAPTNTSTPVPVSKYEPTEQAADPPPVAADEGKAGKKKPLGR